MSLFKKLERRDYVSGTFSNPYGLEPGQIPTNGMLSAIGAGNPLSVDSAMSHWAVYACVRIVADTVSSLPIDVFTGNAVPISPTPSKLIVPSAYATKLQWLWQVMASLLLKGNAYGLIVSTDRLEYPQQIDIINPAIVVPQIDKKTGQKVYRIGGKTLTTDQVWHLPGPQMPGCLEGMSPIAYAGNVISLGLETEQWGSDFYRNGISPTAVVTTDQQIDGDQAAIIKQRVKNAASNRDVAVLGAGLTMTKWQMTAQDAQFIDNHRLNALAVSQIFGVPPEMIGSAASNSGTLTYANREQRAQDFLSNAVNPWLTRLEESLSAWFPRGTYVKFNTGALLKSDLLTRYQAYEIGIRNNFELVSEVRALENLVPIPGIDDKPLPSAGTPPTQGNKTNGQQG